MESSLKSQSTRRSTRPKNDALLTPPATPRRSRKRVADEVPVATPKRVNSPSEAPKSKMKKSVYVRKTKIDPHVARMDARLAEQGALTRKTASTNQDDELEFEEDNLQPLHGPLFDGPLFDDPANGVQPRTTACQWTPMFTPMASPLGLIQERLFYCPWRLLVATIFLNKTRGSQARPILFEFLRRFPTPEECIGADVESLATLLRPLGLYNRRARSLVLFSRSYIDSFAKIQKLLDGDEEDDGFDVTELYGIGQYGRDSFHLFCNPSSWESISVDDKELKKYVAWRRRVTKKEKE